MFSRVYGAVAALGEHTGLGEARQRVMVGARGRLLVVGLGPGHDLEHLPDEVTSVVAVEPSAPMRDAARDRVVAARARGLEVEVVDAVAEELPLPDASIDAILFAYVLCSVDDVPGALAEAWRVLRPGGTVHVLEHVAARPGSVTSWVQRATAPVWPRLTGGCHADRDTRAALVEAGFDDDGLRDTTLANVPVVSPTLVGTARRG